MTYQTPGNCQARHLHAMAPMRPLLVHWRIKSRDSQHPEFLLWSKPQTPGLIQEGPSRPIWLKGPSMHAHLFKDGFQDSKGSAMSVLRESAEWPQGILQGWRKPSGRLGPELGPTAGLVCPTSTGLIYPSGQGSIPHLSLPHLPTLASLWASDTDHTLSTHLNG